MCEKKSKQTADILNNLSNNNTSQGGSGSGAAEIHHPSQQVLSIHNSLSHNNGMDKENNYCSVVEKNLRRTMEHQTLRPALRSSQHYCNSAAADSVTTQQQQQKVRFNLGNATLNSSAELTPPPKEFKRAGNQRKTMRPFSALVTESELRSVYDYAEPIAENSPESTPVQASQQMLPAHLSSKLTPISVDSPKPPQGFVRSMCQLFTGSNSAGKSQLNRSNSFSGKSADSSNNSARSSFRLFRSNSWSSRNKNKNKASAESESPESQQCQPVMIRTQQRCSPSYSTKSQDSGFSENAAASAQQSQPIAENKVKLRSASTSQLRLQFLRASMELSEDSMDPNLTQLPSCSANSQQLLAPQTDGAGANEKVAESLGNIASIQTGLRVKQLMAEENHPGSLEAPTNGAKNLLRPTVSAEKIRPKSFQESVNDLSALSQADDQVDQPVFSTPVRASFRQKRSARPATAIMLEDAKTPMKREGKLSRLRELKTKGRRWSACGATPPMLDKDAIVSGDIIDRSEIPSGIDPSMIAVWSQFLSYEPSIPTLSSIVTPSFNNQKTPAQQHAGQQLSSQIAPPSAPRANQLTSAVISVDEQLSLGQLSATQLSQLSAIAEHDFTIVPENQNQNKQLLECSVHNASSSLEGSAIIELEQAHMSPNSAQVEPRKLNTTPVLEWWRDLHAWCEPECMTYLQSKPILSTPGATASSPMSTSSPSSTASSSSPSSPYATGASAAFFSSEPHNEIVQIMKRIRRAAKSVRVTFTSMEKHLQASNFPQMGKTVQMLLSQVQKFIYDYNMGRYSSQQNNYADYSFLSAADSNGSGLSGNSATDWNFPGLRKNVNGLPNLEAELKNNIDDEGAKELLMLQQRTVLQTVDRLKLCAHRSQYTPHHPTNEMGKILSQLEKSFNCLVEKMLAKELKPLTKEVDQPSSEIGLRSALHCIIAIGNENDNNSCVILSKEGAVRSLLRQANHFSQKSLDVRILALRGLSAICCVAECIREFEKNEGLRVIEELLCSRGSCIEDRIEAAGVLAQITSPWVSDNHKIANLDNHVLNMVNALTGLSRLNGGEETFLLVTAALANLTFMSPLSSSAMKRCGTPEALIKSVKRSPFTTIFAKDQVVTVLANMAGNANCRHDIEAIDGVGFLLTMLETRINGPEDLSPAELSAAERVQKKSAIALSRLCNSTRVCRDLIRLNGIDRLVELCREPEERNYSDAVLVSCLAVLRRLKANLNGSIGLDFNNVLTQLKAGDLVKPNIVDSFMEYSSSKHESYV